MQKEPSPLHRPPLHPAMPATNIRTTADIPNARLQPSGYAAINPIMT